MSDTTSIVVLEGDEQHAESLPDQDPNAPAVGRWYWVTHKEERYAGQRWFGCCTHVGSNYCELKGPMGWDERIHEEHFNERCTLAPEPEKLIQERIGEYQLEVHESMAKIREVTNRLAIHTGPSLPGHSETQSLAIHTGHAMDAYKTALVVAKEKTLPDLFKQIEKSNEYLALWMSAPLIPLKAQAAAMKPAMESISDRIFSVELYAGLVENVEKIQDGKPAPLTEKIHLFQRRAYMDEECLANYETGGMEFKNMDAFNRWFVRPDNLARLLPFPRCIMAFQVRRNRKDRGDCFSYGDLIKMRQLEDLDKLTFLYIRNGEQVFCLGTSIEFDQKLFPDMSQSILNGKIYAKCYSGGRVEDLISENEWLGMREEEAKAEREYAEKKAANEKLPKEEREYIYLNRPSSPDYRLFDRSNIYYDDISKHVHDEMTKHNRLVLVLQGLLDRSPVLHPHPPWQLWTDGFSQALEPIYDDSRALGTGDKPDFEAFRQRLNESLKVGSVTVGQDDEWELAEGKKESERRERSGRGDYHPERYRPSGNPGPGTLARVARMSKRSKTCTYEWTRRRSRDAYNEDAPPEIACHFTTKSETVLNIDAYRPGDFRQFFNDPRTRAEYLQWAWMLLEAEEFHAGNRKVADLKPMPPRHKTEEGAQKYRIRTRNKALVNKAVRLNRDISTTNGKTYKEGSLWRVTSLNRGTFNISAINEDGSDADEGLDWKDKRRVCKMGYFDLEIDWTIPPEPPPKTEKAAASPPEPEPEGDGNADAPPPEDEDDEDTDEEDEDES